jgi:fibronectin-binding autotransporter adhesin
MRVTLRAHRRLVVAASIAAAATLATSHMASAADSSWIATGGGNWVTAANWLNNTVPGINPGTTNTDTATFNLTGGSGTVVVDAGRNLENINFNGSIGAYNLSAGPLVLTAGGAITDTVTSASNQTISSAITLPAGSYSFNDASTTSLLLFTGNISGGDVNTGVLNFYGTHTTGSAIMLNGSLSGYNGSINVLTTGMLKVKLTGSDAPTGSQTFHIGADGDSTATSTLWVSGVTLGSNASVIVSGAGNAENFGALRLDGGTVNGTVTLDTANATIGASSGTSTINGAINGSGGLTVINASGTFTLVLTGANSYTGGTTFGSVGGDTLRVGSNTALGTGPVAFNASTTLATISGGQAVTLANNISIGSAFTATFDGGFANLTLNGNISGLGIVKTTSIGTTSFGGSNTYTGGTLLTNNGGFTTFTTAASVPTTGTINISSGATLVATSGTASTAGGSAYSAAQFLNSGLLLNTSVGTLALADGVTSSEPLDFTQNGGYNALVLSSTGTATQNGTVTPGTGGYLLADSATTGNFTIGSSLQAAAALTKTGVGAVTLSGTSNTYAGATNLNAGTLNVASGAAVNGTASITMKTGVATLLVNGTVTTTGALASGVAAGTNAISVTSTGSLNVGSLSENYPNATTVNGPITVGGLTTITTGGPTTLAGTSTLTTTTFNVGNASVVNSSINALIVNGGGSIGFPGSLPATFNQSAGTVTFSASTANAVVIGNAVPGGGVNASGTYNLTGAGSVLNVVNAPVSLSYGGGVTGTLNISNGTANLKGLAVVGSSSGIGNLNLTGGRLNLGSGGVTNPAGGGTRNLNLGAGTVGAFADWGSSEKFNLTNASTGVTFNTTDSVDGTTAHTITLSNTSSGVGGLNVTGIGRLVLSGVNTYIGATNVNGGTLQVDGATNVSSGVTIASGATLGGKGTVAGAVAVNGTITGASLSGAAGNLSTGAESWNANGKYLANVTAIGTTAVANVNDTLLMSGLTVASPFTVTLQGSGSPTFVASNSDTSGTLGGATAGSYVILAVDAEGGASPFNNPSTIGALNATFTDPGVTSANGGTDTVQLAGVSDGTNYDLIAEDVAATPEPTSLLLAGLAVAPLALRRRRRGVRADA